jgi:hypothetical protein
MATTTPNNGWSVPTSTDYVAQGAVAIETLGDAIDASVGTGLLAWTAYTPSFVNFTLGNGTISFAYSQLGKIVQVRGLITLGTTSSVTGSITFSTPVNSFTSTGQPIVGHARYNDTGTTAFSGMITQNNASAFGFQYNNVAGTYPTINPVNATNPHTWAATDVITCSMTYQAA